MTAYERQNSITMQINSLGDCFEQYSYLILLSGQHPPMPEEFKTDDHLVKGCQSLVWVKVVNEGGILHVWADSDTLIMKGILSIITEIVDGASCDEVAMLEFDMLNRTDLALVFGSERLTGINRIWNTIKSTALESMAS